ncbi:MAG: hypothetical protein ABI091_30430 [Ferruginibacter sp.]
MNIEKNIKIFKSFEDQEQYQLELMSRVSVNKRFEKLYEMQKTSRLLHPQNKETARKIIIKHGSAQR